jgi:hypothetical protein
MNRCNKCILPATYPGIKFNEKGVCQYCTETPEKLNYVGLEPFVETINKYLLSKKDRNKKYDCLLGFSGGRDSTYLLYILTKELGMNVLCYSADHGYVPDVTKLNMKSATDILKSTLVIEPHDYLKKSIKHVLSTWIHRPSLPMIETFCTGCKRGVESGTINFAKTNKIPVVIRGETPFEYPHYRFNLMKLYSGQGWFPMILGYMACVAKNPRWFLNATYVYTQVKDYLLFHDFKNNFRKHGLILLEPFFNNIKWDEKQVMSTIEKELHWSKNPKSVSSWRTDCSIALLKLYVYNEILGFNDRTVGLSYLIRDGQITREAALKRIKNEGQIPDDIIKEILEGIGLKYNDFEKATQIAKDRYLKGIRF